ncbi:MAG: hypothetical protein QF567_00410 [Candidatus Pacearchaeota archaeon]|jgi:transcription factor E|nr:hypothetical protein [Candidatus Pacearchaeota archaeon]|tara:strand:+ start:176 stop:910 length:735 start_codon:yes stop_codon:yes gene_type:complete
MLKKFLKEVVVIVVGRPVEEIVDLLDSKKHVNEFIIAKKMDITINQTRNILYKLSDSGLVSSIRKKDKRKGWYTYFWKIEIFKSLEFLRNTLEKRIDQLNHQIRSREIKQFYICERCNIEFNEENALLHDFTCNECGNIFSIRDNTKVLREFKKNLNKLEKELDFVEEEVKKEKEKIGKIKLKEIKKQEKLRLEKRKATRKKKIKESIKKKIKKPIKKKKKIKKKIRKNPKIKKIKKKTKKKRR